MTDESMTTETIEEAEVTEEPTGNPELRAAYDREKERRITAERRVIAGDLEAIGLDPDVGLGKAIAKEYDGELTREAIAAYASEEYGFTPVGMDTEGAAQRAAAAAEQAEQLEAASTSVVPAGVEDQLAAYDQRLAEEDATREDAEASLAAKMGAFAQEHYPQ